MFQVASFRLRVSIKPGPLVPVCFAALIDNGRAPLRAAAFAAALNGASVAVAGVSFFIATPPLFSAAAKAAGFSFFAQVALEKIFSGGAKNGAILRVFQKHEKTTIFRVFSMIFEKAKTAFLSPKRTFSHRSQEGGGGVVRAVGVRASKTRGEFEVFENRVLRAARMNMVESLRLCAQMPNSAKVVRTKASEKQSGARAYGEKVKLVRAAVRTSVADFSVIGCCEGGEPRWRCRNKGEARKTKTFSKATLVRACDAILGSVARGRGVCDARKTWIRCPAMKPEESGVAGRIAWLPLAALVMLCVSGCEKPLFPEDLPRSPYERYMTLRGQQRPMLEEGPTGIDQPALRERLKPLGQP